MNKQQTEKILVQAAENRMVMLGGDIEVLEQVDKEIAAYQVKFGKEWEKMYLKDAYKLAKLDHQQWHKKLKDL